ncbi:MULTISPECIES: hypothetical protein [unclassified Nocardia]|nr:MULTISPECIES: hypothetical protein [unclassified Nocardia]
MSDTAAPDRNDRRQDRVVWPEPSPLASWWDRVMFAESAGPREIRRPSS